MVGLEDVMTIRVRIQFAANMEPGEPFKIVHCSMDAAKMLPHSSALRTEIAKRPVATTPFDEALQLEKRIGSYVRLMAAENRLDQTLIPIPRLLLVSRRPGGMLGAGTAEYEVRRQLTEG